MKIYGTSTQLAVFFILIGWCFLGCEELLYGRQEEIKKTPDFFVCNYWVDKDQDGRANSDEYVGIKKRFRSHEPITFVSKVRGKQGAVQTLKVWSGAGKLVVDKSMTVKFKSQVWCPNYKGWELARKGLYGDCVAKWYLNDYLIKRIEFAVTN